MAQAHAAVGGTQRGRRFATQQINRAYAILLASQFQGFCRDLHSECVDHLVSSLTPNALQPIVRAEFTRNRQLDRGNAQPGSLGSDFGRLGVDFWTQVDGHDVGNPDRKTLLEELNSWRNAIVHQDFDPAKLGGTTTLHLTRVRRWRRACEQLARSFDEVMRRHVQSLIGGSPW
jgi:hypothetical protein